MTALLPADLNRLARLLGMLGSDHLGELDNAARTAHRLVQQRGCTWFDVGGEAAAGDWVRRCASDVTAQDAALARAGTSTKPTNPQKATHSPIMSSVALGRGCRYQPEKFRSRKEQSVAYGIATA
jgi:hypothetical protein